MHTHLIRLLVPLSLLVVHVPGCVASSGKPFNQMTAQEHRVAAARESQLAADSLAKVTGENIEPPETYPSWDVYYYEYEKYGGAVPYTYEPYVAEPGSPQWYIAWPRISDPSEKYEDAASKHLENAMRHERAAAALEGKPSPQPLPPDRTDQQLLDNAG